MAKRQNDLMLDAALDYLANNAAAMIACSAEPTTYAEATSTYALADVAIDSSDFTKADGDTSGRKTTVAQQSGVTVDASGDATHVAIVSADALLYVTTCTTQTLTEGNTMTFPAWDIELADPT